MPEKDRMQTDYIIATSQNLNESCISTPQRKCLIFQAAHHYLERRLDCYQYEEFRSKLWQMVKTSQEIDSRKQVLTKCPHKPKCF